MLTNPFFAVLYLFCLLPAILCGCKRRIGKFVYPTNQLPKATESGTNTFGCLINGKPMWVHKPYIDIKPAYGAKYQLIYTSNNGFSFTLHGTNRKSGCDFETVIIILDSTRLSEGTFLLNTLQAKYGKTGSVNISKSCSSGLLMYATNETVNGEITITHFDPANLIVSGTFQFDAVETSRGDVVHITNGRFDMHYSQ